jgi:hypothetical protein
MRTDVKVTKARYLREGMWIAYDNPRQDQYIVDCQSSRGNEIRFELAYTDDPTAYPGCTQYLDADETVWVRI